MAAEQYDQLRRFVAATWRRGRDACEVLLGALRREWGPLVRAYRREVVRLCRVAMKRILSLAKLPSPDGANEGRGVGPGLPPPVPPPIVSPGPAPIAPVQVAPLRLWPRQALGATARRAACWLACETRSTIQAISQCVGYKLEHFVWQEPSTAIQPPPVRPDRATHLRAVAGGSIVVLVVGSLLMAIGLSSLPRRAAPVGIAVVEEPEPDTHSANPANSANPADSTDTDGWQLGLRFAHGEEDSSPHTGSVAEQKPNRGQVAGSTDKDRTERREIGVRVPIGVPRPSRDYGGRAWSTTGRQYSAPAYNDWGAAARRSAQADYARQRAIEQAQYQAERAMRDYRQQTSGQFGAMGLQWTPGGYGP